MMVTLLTDFGLEDEYVGVMKGVLLTINPSVTVVDLCHQIPAGDITQASWLLSWSWRYFPKGTIHLVVVDPGVGSTRRILCLLHEGQTFLAPDNGVLTTVIREAKKPKIYAVTNRRYALGKISHTFHGRDIFAPAAGYLSKGLAPHRLGPPVSSFKRLPLPVPLANRSSLKGQVIGIDRFGNALTNLPEIQVERLRRKGSLQIRLKGRTLRDVRSSYSAVGRGSPLAIIGSRGLLEIALNGGSAAQILRLKRGDSVEVTHS